MRVDTADIRDVLLQMHRAVNLSGRITVEDAAATLPPAPGPALMVWSRLAQDAAPGAGSVRSAVVRGDGVFVLTGLFGRRTLELVNMAPGWYLKSIRYRDKEIIDETVGFSESIDSSVLELVLSNRGAVVPGRVVDDRGEPVPRATVVIFRTGGMETTPRQIVSSEAGEFRAGPMRAGDYTLVALPASARLPQSGEWERLRRLTAGVERVTLGELDERTVDLRVLIVER